jgi:phage host-nuclease inhibitor protein Gam
VSTDTYNLPDLRANRQRLISELEEAIEAVERSSTERLDALQGEVGALRAAVAAVERRLAEEIALARSDTARVQGFAEGAVETLHERLAAIEKRVERLEVPAAPARSWRWPWRR